MDLLTNPITAQVISICVAGACGFLAAQVKRLSARDKALYEGMKTILRKELVDAYERYVVGGELLSYERKEEVDECYSAYKSLGGNGTGDQMYKAFCDVQVYVIKKGD